MAIDDYPPFGAGDPLIQNWDQEVYLRRAAEQRQSLLGQIHGQLGSSLAPWPYGHATDPKSVWQLADRISAAVPSAEWDKVPTDLSSQGNAPEAIEKPSKAAGVDWLTPAWKLAALIAWGVFWWHYATLVNGI